MDRLRTHFPDREFFMRSQGQVRFIKVSSRLQIAAAATVALLLAAWCVTMASMAISQYSATRDRLALLNREAEVAKSESRVSAYRKNLDAVAFVRFASVYKNFSAADDFRSFLTELGEDQHAAHAGGDD